MIIAVREPRSTQDYMIIPEMPTVHLVLTDGKERNLPLGSRALHEEMKLADTGIQAQIRDMERKYIRAYQK